MVGFSLQVLCIHYMKCDIRLRVTFHSTVGQAVLVLSPSRTRPEFGCCQEWVRSKLFCNWWLVKSVIPSRNWATQGLMTRLWL